MVVRAVGVGATGDHRVDTVGDDIAAHEQLPGRLGRRVRRSRRQRRVLTSVALGHRAVHLVGRDLQEARTARRDPACLEQHVDPDDAGRQERLGIEDGPVDVGLGGEVDDRIDGLDERAHDGASGDVAAHEGQPGGQLRVVADRRQVRLVAGVGQLVEDRDPRPVAAPQDVADEARADEPGSTGDQEVAEPSLAAHAQPRGRIAGGANRPAASSSAAMAAARSSDGTVPASVQCPS